MALCVCPIVDHEFRHDIVEVAARIYEAIAEWIRRLLCQYPGQCYDEIPVNDRTDALKADVNLFFTITNCEIACSR